LVLLNNPVLG